MLVKINVIRYSVTSTCNVLLSWPPLKKLFDVLRWMSLVSVSSAPADWGCLFSSTDQEENPQKC